MKIHVLVASLLFFGPLVANDHQAIDVRARTIANWKAYDHAFKARKVRLKFPRKPKVTKGEGVTTLSAEKGAALYTLSEVKIPKQLNGEKVFAFAKECFLKGNSDQLHLPEGNVHLFAPFDEVTAERLAIIYTVGLLQQPLEMDQELLAFHLRTMCSSRRSLVHSVEQATWDGYPILDLEIESQILNRDSEVVKTHLCHMRIIRTEDKIYTLETVHAQDHQHEHGLFVDSFQFKRKVK